AGRVRPPERRPRDRQGDAGDLRLRVRVRDGAAEPQARPGDRVDLRDRLAALQLPLLDRGEGNGALRRRRLRPGPAGGRERARRALRGPVSRPHGRLVPLGPSWASPCKIAQAYAFLAKTPACT